MDKPLILIADDDERLLIALTIRLERLGFQVIRALNGGLALEMAQESPPDLLILDINMPTCDGFSLIEKMDKISELQDIPVIYITGADGDGELSAASERLGAMGMIRKPFEIEDLIQSISLVLPIPAAAETPPV